MIKWPKRIVLIEALALAGAVGWFDYATDWEWSFFAPYAIPIVLATWQKGWKLGLVISSVCGLVWCLAHFKDNPYQSGWGFALAVAGWWFYFSVLVVAIAAVKDRLEVDRARIAALERAQELERQMLEITDREQERLGRELHDGLCQTLAGIAALGTTLSRRLAACSELAAATAAAEVARLLHGAIREARDLAHGLGPVGLETAGLAGAIEALAANVQAHFGIVCTLECPRPFVALRHEIELHLFRITQEALNNALAHGRAKRIEICLSCQEGEGLLSLQDDGVGLPDEPAPHRGIGLRTMAHRADLIGGGLEVRRCIPHGTSVCCAFPLPATPDIPVPKDHAHDDK